MLGKPAFLAVCAVALFIGGLGASSILVDNPEGRAKAALSQALPAFSAPATDLDIAPTPESEPRLIGAGEPFHDRFDEIDESRWAVSDGWRNGNWTANDWRRTQVSEDRGLTFTLERKPSREAEFAGGEIQSKRRFGHGYFEARLRAAKGSGTVSAFFTYIGPPMGKPWNEIDVEILGAKPREVMFTYYRDGEKLEHIHRLEFDTTEGFHTYGFDWQPEHLRWYVDGKLVHESSTAQLALPRLEQRVMASLWASETLTSWVGPFDTNALPTQMELTCVTYARDYASRVSCAEDT